MDVLLHQAQNLLLRDHLPRKGPGFSAFPFQGYHLTASRCPWTPFDLVVLQDDLHLFPEAW